MKRRVEEAAKQEGSSSSSVSVGLSGRTSGPPGGPAIVYSGPVRQHLNRGITPPGVGTVASPTYLSSGVNKSLPSERVASSGSSGDVAIPAFTLATTYSSSLPTMATATAIKTAGGGLQGGAPSGPSMQTSLHTLQAPQQVLTQQQHVILPTQPHQPIRHNKVHTGATTPPTVSVQTQPPSQQSQQQFQKLKVEDALSYLDQVKFKFGNQPQVYNDFLDIMKEFKSQSIDTPGVIARVSDLFKGHPELIVGFNTFLPPGYKIEVQQNDQGFAFQVSVSIPSPTASTTTVVHTPGGPISTTTHGTTTTLITPIGPPGSGAGGSNIAVVAPIVQQSTPQSVPQGVSPVGVPTSTPPLQPGQPVPMGKPVTIISSSAPLVGHHQAPLVPSSNHSGPGMTTGPSTVPVLLSNSTGNPVTVASGTVPHHGSAPIHHSYPQPSVAPAAPPQGSTVPHGVNSVSSTSGAQTSVQSHHNAHPIHAPHHLSSGTNLHHAGMAQAVSQAHQAVSQGLPHGETIPHSTQSQPVEFNHAINYVNKIKNRFQGQPDKYKRFLEILHTYQKEQRNLKEGSTLSGNTGAGKHLTEAEVYSQVAKLFENQEDLLAEFGQFLPDATSHQTAIGPKVLANDHHAVKKPTNPKINYGNSNSCPTGRERDGTTPTSGLVIMGTHTDRSHGNVTSASKFGNSGGVKRSPSFSSTTPNSSHHPHHQNIHSGSHSSHSAPHGAHGGHGGQSHGPPPAKKHKACIRDVTLADAGKFGTLNDYAFFDNVRKALRSQEVYTNFLRCLQLFNEEVVSKSELVQLVTPFLGKYPELFRRFKDFIGACEGNVSAPGVHGLVSGLGGGLGNSLGVESIPNNVARQDRPAGDHALEIDYSTCKRLGASYCALPKNYIQPKCTGRTPLCKEVLNDTWVSFPTWSEDSTFVTSRKTQYEEYIYRCEDERFELDVVIETNAATIRVLEGVHKKLQRLSAEEVAKFRLDDCLGGASPTIHQRALKRIYGDKAADIIDGLKKNPSVAVPVVLRRLKSKEEEWREAQKGFNKIWREQNEKYYLKSLDHQGINFKQNDVKQLRSKSLFNEIETLFDERHEQAEEGSETTTGPHLVLPYKDKTVLNDAAELLIHHVKRQTSIHKEDKQRIKQLLRHFLPDLFFHPRQELSDDERDDAENDDDSDANASKTAPFGDRRDVSGTTPKKDEESETDVKPPPHAVSQHPDECYSLFFGNNNWYLFYRLHHILCERLTRMYDRAVALANEEAKYRVDRKESTAIALRLKPKSEIDVEDYYPAFLDMVRNVLDGNMDTNAYEDTLREMFGIHAYIAFTLDKVVTYAVRQLQHLVSDDPCTECQEIFLSEQKRGGVATGGPCSTAHQRTAAEVAYQRRAEQALAEENCFKVLIYKRDCKVTIELLDTESEEQEQQTDTSSKWTNFVDRERRFSNSEEPSNTENGDRIKEERDVDGVLLRQRKAVFLARNVRRKKLGESDVEKEIKGIGPVAVPVPASEGNDTTESEKSATDRKKKEKLSSDGDEEMEVDEDVEASGGRRQSKQGKPKPVRLNHKLNIESDNLDGADELQCHFNQNSYRMVYVINRDNYLYREQALPKARQSHPTVSTRLNTKFRTWHNLWAREHVSDAQQKANNDWLMGRGEGVVPNRTRVLTNNDISKAPYRAFNRFRVDRLVSESAPSPAVASLES